jgi:hypothetical protein
MAAHNLCFFVFFSDEKMATNFAMLHTDHFPFSVKILGDWSTQSGSYKEMLSILADHWPIAPSYMSPTAGRGGSCGVSASLQINCGDLNPYLTHGLVPMVLDP